MKNSFILMLILLLSAVSIKAQRSNVAYEKGTFYAFWGWNRGYYTNSNIHFKGPDYNFTLERVRAHDHVSPFSYHNYFQPNRITIPQTNFKIGYFFKDNMAVSIGVDHMKYVMDQNQTVDIRGRVPQGFQDMIIDGQIRLTEDFLMFEHTDGLNYINAEFEYFHNFYTYKFIKINGLAGAGAGFLLPKTNATLFAGEGGERHDDFHISGFGLNAKIGIDLLFWNHFFIRSEGKEGYINMPSIRTTSSSKDKASQYFWFAEANILFGGAWKF